MKGAPVASTAALALAALAGLAGCRSGAEPPRPAARAVQEVADVVKSLERATAEKDFVEICFELFSDRVRAEAGGVRCPALLRRTARDIEVPRIEIRSIVLRPGGATVRVRTRARGQAAAPDAIELVPERGRWRISALGGAGTGRTR